MSGCRIGKVKFKAKNITVYPSKTNSERIVNFRNDVNAICERFPNIDTYSVVAIDNDGCTITCYNAGSRDVDILPHLTEELIRSEINRRNS